MPGRSAPLSLLRAQSLMDLASQDRSASNYPGMIRPYQQTAVHQAIQAPNSPNIHISQPLTRQSKGRRNRPAQFRYFPSPQPFTFALAGMVCPHFEQRSGSGVESRNATHPWLRLFVSAARCSHTHPINSMFGLSAGASSSRRQNAVNFADRDACDVVELDLSCAYEAREGGARYADHAGGLFLRYG